MRNLLYILLLLGLAPAVGFGEETGRRVYLQPDPAAPVIGLLPAENFLLPPPEPVELTVREKEAGWRAIAFLEDFRGHVRQADIRKDLTITVGTSIHLEPDDEAPVLTHAEAEDHFEVEHLDGDWAEVAFRKPLTGFVLTGETGAAPPAATTEVTEVPSSDPVPGGEIILSADTPAAAEAPVPEGPTVSARAALPTDGALRVFQGWLMETRSFFGLGRPFDYQVVDASGNRIAYVDLERLLITEPIDRFVGYRYEIYGRAEPLAGRRDFVIRVERMIRR